MNRQPGEFDTARHELFSPEGVRLDLPIAGPAPRMLAYGIDLTIIVVLVIFLMVALVASLPVGNTIDKWLEALFRGAAHGVREAAKHRNAGDRPPAALGIMSGMVLALFILTQFVVETGYFIFWEMVTNGRSPGKALVGLRVVRRNGMPEEFRNSVLRNAMRIADILPTNYAVGLVSMVLSPSCERLGDHVAGTIVIRLDRPQPAQEIESAASTLRSFTRNQLALIGPRELQLIRATIRRVENNPGDDRREPLLAEVAETLRVRLGLAELPATERLTFLRDLLAATQRYSRSE